MKKTLAIPLFLIAGALSPGVQPSAEALRVPPEQSQAGPGQRQQAQSDLNGVLEQVQRVAVSTNGDIGKLRIEKWKTDSDQKAQLQKVADSLQRNITYAVPGLVSDVQTSHGSVSSAFKLYHNLNVVYEFLSSLADAAGSLGKKEEYEPLAADAAALDAARSRLSQYIEQAAASYEAMVRNAEAAPREPAPPPRIIVDDPVEKAKPAKKKPASKPAAHPSPKPSPKPAPSPSASPE